MGKAGESVSILGCGLQKQRLDVNGRISQKAGDA
jgi:hypothetical protein